MCPVCINPLIAIIQHSIPYSVILLAIVVGLDIVRWQIKQEYMYMADICYEYCLAQANYQNHIIHIIHHCKSLARPTNANSMSTILLTIHSMI